MYESLLPKEPPLVENLYPHFNWKNIWSNFCEIRTDPFDKDIIFKHLHVSLATRSRLAMLNIANNSTCNLCNDDKEQTALHMLYECKYMQQDVYAKGRTDQTHASSYRRSLSMRTVQQDIFTEE